MTLARRLDSEGGTDGRRASKTGRSTHRPLLKKGGATVHQYLRACRLCGGDGDYDPQDGESLLCFRCGKPISEANPAMQPVRVPRVPKMEAMALEAEVSSDSEPDRYETSFRSTERRDEGQAIRRSIHGH